MHKRAILRSQENVTSRRCAEEGCKLIPNFNAPGKTRGLYCKGHAPSDMVCQGCLSLSLRHGAQAPAKACLTNDKLSTGTRCSCRSAERNTMSCKPWPFVQREHVTSAVQCSFVGRRLGFPAAASSLCCEAQALQSDGSPVGRLTSLTSAAKVRAATSMLTLVMHMGYARVSAAPTSCRAW